MDKQKAIEEIAQVIVKYNCKPCGCEHCEWCPEDGSCDDYASYHNIANNIYDAGYGNIKQALTEFLERLKKNLIPIIGISNNEIIEHYVSEKKIDETLKEFLNDD